MNPTNNFEIEKMSLWAKRFGRKVRKMKSQSKTYKKTTTLTKSYVGVKQ